MPGTGSRWSLLVAAALIAGACAQPTKWVHPERTEAQTDDDSRDCQRRAQMTAESEFLAVQQSRRVASEGRVPAVIDSMDQQEARNRQRQLYERCMLSLGYSRETADQTPPPASGAK